MKRLIIAAFLALSLSGCANKADIPAAPIKVVQVSDLTPPPDIGLMQPMPPKKALTPGMTNGEALGVMRDNNIRSNTIENNAESLQQYVCNLFPDKPAGPVCIK